MKLAMLNTHPVSLGEYPVCMASPPASKIRHLVGTSALLVVLISGHPSTTKPLCATCSTSISLTRPSSHFLYFPVPQAKKAGDRSVWEAAHYSWLGLGV